MSVGRKTSAREKRRHTYDVIAPGLSLAASIVCWLANHALQNHRKVRLDCLEKASRGKESFSTKQHKK
jgi:hypothetical protein